MGNGSKRERWAGGTGFGGGIKDGKEKKRKHSHSVPNHQRKRAESGGIMSKGKGQRGPPRN